MESLADGGDKIAVLPFASILEIEAAVIPVWFKGEPLADQLFHSRIFCQSFTAEQLNFETAPSTGMLGRAWGRMERQGMLIVLYLHKAL